LAEQRLIFDLFNINHFKIKVKPFFADSPKPIMTKKMSILTQQINKILKDKGLSHRRLAQIIGEHDSSLNSMIRSKRAFPDDVIQKIAPVLEVSPETIKGWILADKYPKSILKMAIEVKQEITPESDKLILTVKIDKLLKPQKLSRTGLSKVIGYNQGKLNKMIKGVEPISPLVISRIAPVLDVSEEEIISWTVADRYSLEALRVAIGI